MNEDVAQVVHSCHDCQKKPTCTTSNTSASFQTEVWRAFPRVSVKKADFDALQADSKAF